MDESLIVKIAGRVVGVAVRVRGGFMFFSSEPALNVLEARVFRHAEMVTRRVAEIVETRKNPREESALQAPPS